MDKALTEPEFNWLISRREKYGVFDFYAMTNPLSHQERFLLNIMRYRRAIGLSDDAPTPTIAEPILFMLNLEESPTIHGIPLFKFDASCIYLGTAKN